MSKKIDFENLRREIALKGGSALENLLKSISLIKGMKTSIYKNSQKITNSEKTFMIFLDNFEKILINNIQLVKEGGIEALNLISLLEREVIDKKLLEKETKILKRIVLSRENIINWKSYAKEILKELRSVYEFDGFFIISEENGKLSFNIFFSYNIPEKDKQIIRKKLLEHFRNSFNHLIQKNIKYEETYLTARSIRKSFSDIHFETFQFLPESPEMGGIAGLIVMHEKKLNKKEREILSSILSIMTLIIGSSKALSKAMSELEYYAGHDPLTDLYNRRTFEEFLKYEVSRAKRKNHKFSLILIDLDNFKYINDTYGHQVGDIVLKSVADILERSVREGDLVARIGGDEFLILLSETGVEDALKVAERIRRNIERNKICLFDGDIISVHGSFGVVEFPTHGESKEELMMVVDNALYKAKDLGKNIVYVPSKEEISSVIYERRRDFHLLQMAIEKKLFFPYFQPIVDLKKSKTFAYEVLARLKDEDGNLVSAYRFISLAENLNKIQEIDKIIIKKSLQLKSDMKIKEKLFINLSAKEISDMQFWSYVYSVINRYEIKPQEIVFEITEREAVKEISEIQTLILKLKEKGFGFAIDDFGSGYSSFYYLKHFPIDFVKIDGEFIRELNPKDPKSSAFIESIKTLCSKLGIKTIAEYIENEETVQILKNIGIHYGQGFFLGTPSQKFL